MDYQNKVLLHNGCISYLWKHTVCSLTSIIHIWSVQSKSTLLCCMVACMLKKAYYSTIVQKNNPFLMDLRCNRKFSPSTYRTHMCSAQKPFRGRVGCNCLHLRWKPADSGQVQQRWSSLNTCGRLRVSMCVTRHTWKPEAGLLLQQSCKKFHFICNNVALIH